MTPSSARRPSHTTWLPQATPVLVRLPCAVGARHAASRCFAVTGHARAVARWSAGSRSCRGQSSRRLLQLAQRRVHIRGGRRRPRSAYNSGGRCTHTATCAKAHRVLRVACRLLDRRRYQSGGRCRGAALVPPTNWPRCVTFDGRYWAQSAFSRLGLAPWPSALARMQWVATSDYAPLLNLGFGTSAAQITPFSPCTTTPYHALFRFLCLRRPAAFVCFRLVVLVGVLFRVVVLFPLGLPRPPLLLFSCLLSVRAAGSFWPQPRLVPNLGHLGRRNRIRPIRLMSNGAVVRRHSGAGEARRRSTWLMPALPVHLCARWDGRDVNCYCGVAASIAWCITYLRPFVGDSQQRVLSPMPQQGCEPNSLNPALLLPLSLMMAASRSSREALQDGYQLRGGSVRWPSKWSTSYEEHIGATPPDTPRAGPLDQRGPSEAKADFGGESRAKGCAAHVRETAKVCNGAGRGDSRLRVGFRLGPRGPPSPLGRVVRLQWRRSVDGRWCRRCPVRHLTPQLSQ